MCYIYTLHVYLVPKARRRYQIPQELKLLVVSNHHMGADNQTQVLSKSCKCFKRSSFLFSPSTVLLESMKGDQSPGVRGAHVLALDTQSIHPLLDGQMDEEMKGLEGIGGASKGPSELPPWLFHMCKVSDFMSVVSIL